MAGVGPFAIPAGKRKVFVHANDLNPDSYQGLKLAIRRNKVSEFVTSSCEDGRSFIRRSTQHLAASPRRVELISKQQVSRSNPPKRTQTRAETILTVEEPTHFSHYVMNLPATAVEFLDAFKGIYEGRESGFTPHTGTKLPLLHVYLFQAKKDTEEDETQEIMERISKHLGVPVEGSDSTLELELFYVRLVAPKKKMYCASFRLPASVAFNSI